MDFTSGNSGSLLREAVIKTGPEVRQEGAYAQLLGKEVCPEIYALLPDGYVMERLKVPARFPSMLFMASELLANKVWNRSALPVSTEWDWKDSLRKYGIEVPYWAIPEEYCMVHGDPTESNMLLRGSDLILCDPRPPRAYIPQCRETDLGRLMQSAYDWEVVAYGAKPVNFHEPDFRNSLERQRAIFWCGAAAARIEYLERSRDNRRHILDWCQETRMKCNV
jgi:hypothetical protein